jgi:cytosine/uracil/thiamine/allantoin permease
MKRRRPARIPLIRSAFAFRIVLLAITALSVVGFIHFTKIVIVMQKHFAPEAIHPWDMWANGCFCMALIALALFFLARTEQPVKRTPKRRAKTESLWRKARSLEAESDEARVTAKRTRRRSGYNGTK